MSIEVDEMLLSTPKDYIKELEYRHKCMEELLVDIIVKLISENGYRVHHILENAIVLE